MGDVGHFHFLGFIVSWDSYMNRWEVIRPTEEGKLEVSYRRLRTCKDAEAWCIKGNMIDSYPVASQNGSLLLNLKNKLPWKNLPLTPTEKKLKKL